MTPRPTTPFPRRPARTSSATTAVNADEDMAQRYGEVSGDWSSHHYALDSARRSGFDRLFLHGLCTMGLCAQGIVALVAAGDPDRVRRVAVRFASPTFLGEDLEMRLYRRSDDHTYAFEAQSNGAPVVRNGLAELRT